MASRHGSIVFRHDNMASRHGSIVFHMITLEMHKRHTPLVHNMITQHADMIESNFERISLRTDKINKLLNWAATPENLSSGFPTK